MGFYEYGIKNYNVILLIKIADNGFKDVCGHSFALPSLLGYVTTMTHIHFLFILNFQSATVNNLNFHPLEVVSRYRDPQLQVDENYSYLFILKPNICKSWCTNTHANNGDLKYWYIFVLQHKYWHICGLWYKVCHTLWSVALRLAYSWWSVT